MDARRLLKRVEAARHDQETLRSVGRDVGHELADRNLPELREVAAGLALSGGEPLKPWFAGYRAALGDLLSAYDAELSELEHEKDVERLVHERQHWASVLRELAKDSRTPSELQASIGIADSGQMSRLLAQIRGAGLAEIRVLEHGDSRTRPHELTLLGERIAEKLGATEPDKRQLEAYRLVCSVLARVVCEGRAEPAALEHSARIALGEKSTVDARAATAAVLKEAANVGVIRVTDDGYAQSDLAVPSAVRCLLEKDDPKQLWTSLTQGFASQEMTFLVRASSETESAWKHFFIRNDVRGARILDFGDLGSVFEPPTGNVVLVYDTCSLRAQDLAAHRDNVLAIERGAVARMCFTTEPSLVPQGYAPFMVEATGKIPTEEENRAA